MKKNRILTSYQIFILILLTVFNIGLFAYSGGSGTNLHPYQIGTLSDLQQLSETPHDWDKHFIQIANINASATSGWNDGAGFLPIGNSPTCGDNTPWFSGSYNGQDYTITSLFIDSAESYIGFMGYVYQAELLNINLENIDVTGLEFTGGLAGYSENQSTISNCSSEGSVIGSGATGGLVGYIKNYCTISNCSSEGSIAGTVSVGGLVGEFRENSDVNDCISNCSVVGQEEVGGLIGRVIFKSGP